MVGQGGFQTGPSQSSSNNSDLYNTEDRKSQNALRVCSLTLSRPLLPMY